MTDPSPTWHPRRVIRPLLISPEELDARHGTRARLASGGDYGCSCAVFEGDLVLDGDHWLGDEHFSQLQIGAAPRDIGTVVVTGALTVRGDIQISDRLMCFIVLGDLVARALKIYETEVYVGGDLRLERLDDRDEYLKVEGRVSVGEGPPA